MRLCSFSFLVDISPNRPAGIDNSHGDWGVCVNALGNVVKKRVTFYIQFVLSHLDVYPPPEPAATILK